MKEKQERPFLNLDNRQRKLAKVFQRFGYTVHLPLKEDSRPRNKGRKG